MNLNYQTKKNAQILSKFWGKSLDRPDWFKINNQADETEIFIYDVIGFPFMDVSAFVQELSSIKAPEITVRINSPGGNFFDGLTIKNALSSHPAKIITKIEGVAASIASIIALAGDEVQAYDNSMVMIHNAWVLISGNSGDLIDMAAILQKLDGNLLNIYQEASGLAPEDIKSMMDAETWFTATEALDKGFIDTILDSNGEPIKAAFDLSIFNNTPKNIKSEKRNIELTKREVEIALRDAGASRSFAKTIASIAAGSGINSNNQMDAEMEEEIRNLIKKLKDGK